MYSKYLLKYSVFYNLPTGKYYRDIQLTKAYKKNKE